MKAIDLTLFFAQELLLLCKRYQQARARNKRYAAKTTDKKRAYRKKYCAENLDKIRASAKKYYEVCRNKIAAKRKIYCKNNADAERARHRKYRAENPEKVRNFVKDREKRDPAFKLLRRLRARVRQALFDQRTTKSARTLALLGCSAEECKAHLEKQFEPWMTWDNHGEWHVDHIRPCSSFNLADPEQQKQCFHFSNLQPLRKIANLQKGDSYVQN